MLILIYRTTIVYFTVIIAMRFMGKRQVGEMSAPEIIFALLISDIAAIPLSNSEIPLIHGIASIATLVILEIIISYIDLKFPSFTMLLQGKPVIIVKDGKIDQNSMNKTRLTISEFNEELRYKNIKLKDIHTAIIERTGQISIIPKNCASGVTREDMNIKSKDEPLEFAVVTDGKINYDNLRLIGKDKTFIDNYLLSKRIKNVKNVFVMLADTRGVTFLQEQEKENKL